MKKCAKWRRAERTIGFAPAIAITGTIILFGNILLRLVLHVGVQRTATSAIQSFLHANQGRLLDRGMILADGMRRHSAPVHKIFRGDGAAVYEDMRGQLENQGAHTLILSEEDIVIRKSMTKLGRFASRFDEVKVIVALRRQDLWLESWYLQHIKWQWKARFAHATLPEFLKARREFFWIDYCKLLDGLSAAFGRENLRPLVFESGQMPGGPVAAFCRQIGIDGIFGWNPPLRRNQSLSPRIAEFVRRLPLHEAPAPLRAKLEAAAMNLDEKIGAKGSALLIPHEERYAIMREYEKSNSKAAARYFGRDQLFAEPLPAPDAPLGAMTLPQETDELMSSIVAGFVSELIATYAKKG